MSVPDDLETGLHAQPIVHCGYLWSDTWCSPYVRRSFAPPGRNATLLLTLYNPDFRQDEAFVRVRVGTHKVAELGPIAPGETHDAELSLGPYIVDGMRLDVSLRCLPTWWPDNGDERALGLIVARWEIVD